MKKLFLSNLFILSSCFMLFSASNVMAVSDNEETVEVILPEDAETALSEDMAEESFLIADSDEETAQIQEEAETVE